MKHMVTNPNDPSETVMFSRSILGNFCFDIFFELFEVELSHTANSNNKSELLH